MHKDVTIPLIKPAFKVKKFVLVVLVVGIMIFSCVVIVLYFLSYIL
jgi:hypothetical protein